MALGCVVGGVGGVVWAVGDGGSWSKDGGCVGGVSLDEDAALVETDTLEIRGVIGVTRPREVDPRVTVEFLEEPLFGNVAVGAV
jgi:hypothetical protein